MFIEANVALFPVQAMCEALGVSRSGYYAWAGRPERARAAEDRAVAAEIRAAHEASRGRYGSPRVHAELRAHGRRVGRKRVARLMRGMGLSARRKRRFRRTTDSAHALPVAPNLLGRDFTAAAPDRVWLADLTYIWTAEGWLYLAAVLDLFTRRVVGRLGHGRAPRPRARAGRARHGHRAPPPRARLGAPLGPRGAIRRARVPQEADAARHALLDEPQGWLLGQRPDGERLRHAEPR